MNDREKTLTTVLVMTVIGAIALAGALIAKDQDNERYKAIMDVACDKTYNVTQCKAGLKVMMNMSPEEIRSYGSFKF